MIDLFQKSTLQRLALITVAVGLAACTKKEESSSLNIQMPNWNTLTEKYSGNANAANAKGDSSSGKFVAFSGTTVTAVTRVMINISGPGMPTAVRIWDLNEVPRQPGVIPTPPPEFSFDVPRGADRLFQALVIVEDIDPYNSDGGGGPMTFLYGDIAKPVALSVETVPIVLTSQSIVQGIESSVSGRYLTSAGVGPTGPVNMYYAPPGRPEMIVEKTSIFSGFFHFFVPPVAQFSFKMANSGVSIFDKITSSSFDGSFSSRLLKVSVPAGFRNSGSGQATRSPVQARARIVGYFGPGAATEAVCFKSTGSGLQNLYVNATPGNNTLVEWSAGSSSPADARVLGGGVAFTDDACPGGYGEFGSGHLFVRTQSITNGDSPVGLRGPFEEVSANSQNFLSASFTGNTLNLNWKYLRPTIGDSVDGVGVFTRIFAAGENTDLRWHDSAPCRNLASLGFNEVTRVAAGTPSTPVESYTLTGVDAQAYTNGRHVTVMCPYSNVGGYYNFALVHKTGSNNSQISATQLAISRLGGPATSTVGTPTNMISDACTPIVIRSLDSFGNLARKQSGTPNVYVAVTDPATVTGLYSTSNCDSGAVTSITLDMSHPEKVVYARTTTPATTFSISVSDNTGTSPTLTPATFYATRTSGTTATHVMTMAPSIVYRNECFPVVFSRGTTSAGEFTPQAGPASTSVNVSSILAQTGMQFYTEGNCETTMSTPMMTAASSSSVRVYAVYSGNLASISFFPAVSGLTTINANTTVLSPGAAARTQLVLSQVNSSTCVPTRVYAQDQFGRPALVDSNTLLNFSFTTAPPNSSSGIFSDPTCSAAISSITIPSGQYRSGTIYFRWSNMGAVQLGSGVGSTLPMVPALITVGSP